MGLIPLRLAFEAWVRHPREMAMANGAWMLAVALPLPLALLLPGGAFRAVFVVLALLWLWLGSGALCAACAQVLGGQGFRPSALRAWLAQHWLERLAALAIGILGAAWSTVAVRFYLGSPFSPWIGVPLLAVAAAFAVWLLLALLASIGVAAGSPAGWRPVWKTSALMPLAFGRSWLGAALLLLLLSGLPALLIGVKHRGAALLLAPLLMAPFFTAAFYASYLVLLVQGLLERAAGREGPLAPDWRELWSPWR